MEHFFKYLSLIIALFVVSCISNSRNNGNSNKIEEKLDDYAVKIDSLIQTTSPRKFNGVLLITQNGETKYSKAYGYSNFEDKISITTKDNFRIQSNSKQITAVLVLKEVEKGNINLKSPIKKYLPEINQSWANAVTVHQLLNMSSGIIDLEKPLIFEPGTNFHYSNPAYFLLGEIIEKTTGKKYVEVANNLFKELGMYNSFCYEMNMSENENLLINGYRVSNDAFELVKAMDINRPYDWADFIPAGGIISNLEDLNIWDMKLHNGRILKPEIYALMTDYNITGQNDAFGTEKIGYGYGVMIDDSKPLKIIGHSGRGLGFTNIKFYIPSKKADVIVLENVYDEDESIIYHFEKKIKEIVMNSSLTK